MQNETTLWSQHHFNDTFAVCICKFRALFVIFDYLLSCLLQHCFENPAKVKNYKVKTGTSSVYLGEMHDVVSIIKHPEYKDHNYDYDFAIIKIKTPMAFNNQQRPIALVENESETPKAGDGVRVLGW